MRNLLLVSALALAACTAATPNPDGGISADQACANQATALCNLLNTCTAAATSSPCDQLFASTTPGGASAPSNTFDAALNLVRNPGSNVAAIYTQAVTSSAFAPALTTAPADWTLFISHSGGGMNSPSSLGVDSAGNIWVASYFSAAAEFSPTGSALFPNAITSGGLSESYGLAIDAQNNVWITNEASPATINGSKINHSGWTKRIRISSRARPNSAGAGWRP